MDLFEKGVSPKIFFSSQKVFWYCDQNRIEWLMLDLGVR